MSFAMIHLSVAQKVLGLMTAQAIDKPACLPAYYLGSIAPDAVHNRPGYIPAYKKASHFITSDEAWGMVTDHTTWMDNTKKRLQRYKQTPYSDFVLGYCTHIYTDVYNNIAVWIPFREQHAGGPNQAYGGQYHAESHRIDIEMALTDQHQSEFWQYLAQAQGIDFEGVVSGDEIHRQRDYIVYEWYTNQPRQDISAHTVVTWENAFSFIEKAAVFVMEQLR